MKRTGSLMFGLLMASQVFAATNSFTPVGVNPAAVAHPWSERSMEPIWEAGDLEDRHIDMSIGRWLDVESIGARRDTKLLDLGWIENVKKTDTWDGPYPSDLQIPRVREQNRCWAVAVQALNRFYGGNVTQDEIVVKNFYTIDEPLLSAFHAWGSGFEMNEKGQYVEDGHFGEMFKWALNVEKLNVGQGAPSYDVVKNAIDNGRPIYVEFPGYYITESNGGKKEISGHAAVLYGYAGSADNYVFFFMNMIGNVGGFANSAFFDREIGSYAIPEPTYGNVRMTDPLVSTDTDGDGLMDFDEYRFDTKVNSRDSDGDGIEDKREIYNYTLKVKSLLDDKYDDFYKCKSLNANSIPRDCRDLAVIKKVSDVNQDGRLAQMDNDDDDDGIIDGLLPEGSKYSYHGLKSATYDVPGAYTLFGREYVRLMDKVLCYNTPVASESYCDVASDNDYMFAYAKNLDVQIPVLIGSGSRVNDVGMFYNPGVYDDEVRAKIHLRSGAKIHGIVDIKMSFIDSTLVKNKSIFNNAENYIDNPNGEVVEGGSNVSSVAKTGSFRWIHTIPNYHIGKGTVTVEDGETFHLKDGMRIHKIVVKLGGTLIVEPGEMYVNFMEVHARSNVKFSEPGKGTVLHMVGDLLWESYYSEDVENTAYWTEVAKGFKLIHHSSSKLTLTGPWAGTIYAPLAPVEFRTKTVYGRVLSRNIVVNQGTSVYRVDFDPVNDGEEIEISYLVK